MTTPSNAVNGAFEPQPAPAAALQTTRPFYWSVRRELFEYRSIYLAPLAISGVILLGFVFVLVRLPRTMQRAMAMEPMAQRQSLAQPFDFAVGLIMAAAFIISIFYAIDSLYGERRDRSILFWKSLPVSDLIAVLSKLTIPLVILPLLSFAISLATQFIMLLLSSAILAGSGVNIAALWAEVSFFHVSLVLLYHLLTVHGLWYAPLYGWLLLVSAWARRAPFVWAFLPPFVICGVEKIAFNTSHFVALLQDRLLGPGGSMAAHNHQKDFMTTLIPDRFFSTPGLWIGLVVTAAFLTAAVRLRRSQGPI